MGKFTMDKNLQDKIDTLSANFTQSEAYKNTSPNKNPYPKLAEALEQHTHPQDGRIILAVLDDVVAHKNHSEILQGATEGKAIEVLTQLVNQDSIRTFLDRPYEVAVESLSSTLKVMAEARILENQTDREMLREKQTDR
jgi:hypothetical protein